MCEHREQQHPPPAAAACYSHPSDQEGSSGGYLQWTPRAILGWGNVGSHHQPVTQEGGRKKAGVGGIRWVFWVEDS